MEPDSSAKPRLLGRYELIEEAGRGAMGVVYRALDRESGRVVALKALHGADPDDLYRLKNEFRALAGVVHPHLVRLYEMSVEADRGFFTMELIEGARTLVEYVRSQAAPETALREAFGQLASALAFLHEAGWIHRDLKPSNVLVDAKGPRLCCSTSGWCAGSGQSRGNARRWAPSSGRSRTCRRSRRSAVRSPPPRTGTASGSCSTNA